MVPTYAAVIGNAHVNNMYAGLGGKGHFNDADMLEIGNGKLSLAECRTHYALWCLMKSPLLIGGDLQTMKQDFIDILSNKELIAWNQDEAGVQGTFRASYPYADGDDRGQQPPPLARAPLVNNAGAFTASELPSRPPSPPSQSAAANSNTAGSSSTVPDTFGGMTYCAYTDVPSSQKWTLSKLKSSVYAIKQDKTCLTAKHGAGNSHQVVSMSSCDGSKEQEWVADDVGTWRVR